MVCCVSAHEDEGVWVTGHARETTDMSDGVAGRVQEVETSVAEVIGCVEATDFETPGLEIDFARLPAFEVCFQKSCVFSCWVGWKMGGFETWAYDEICGGRKCGGVSDVVPVMVGPDDCTDASVVDVNAVVFEDCGDVFFDFDFPLQSDPFLVGGIVLPVFAHTEIKQDRF